MGYSGFDRGFRIGRAGQCQPGARRRFYGFVVVESPTSRRWHGFKRGGRSQAGGGKTKPPGEGGARKIRGGELRAQVRGPGSRATWARDQQKHPSWSRTAALTIPLGT